MPYNSYDIHMKDPNSKKPLLRRCMPYRGWGYPDVCRIRGSVLPSCVPILFFSALFSAFIVTLYLIFEINLTIPESLVGTVAVVVGLLLAFRTNNAYDRYYEGRKLFTSMCTNIRNATRNIWVGVKEHNDADRREKVKNIKLLLAYAVATKRHLRLEFGTDWLDLKSLVPEGFQLTYFDGNATQENTVLGSGHDEDPNRDRSDNANRPSSDTPSVQHSLNSIANRISPTTYNNLRKSMSRDETTIWFGASEWGRDVDASMSLPLEIIYHIGLYIDKVHESKAMDGDRFCAVSGNLNSLVEIIGDLERISDTPIPFAYNIHLKQATLLYVWALPFTIVDRLGWYTIIIVVGVAFVLFGVEAIGAEIENPFGYDRNDLPLDGYCDDLKAEIEYVQRHIPSGKAVPASQSSR